MPLRADRSIRSIRPIAIVIAAVLLAASVLVSAAPAQAAERGTGFGTWAPISPYGWHGSMLVGGVHTYCILPGAPAPTGPSTDHGVRSAVLALSPQQLTGINLLVMKYGQTNDPVQAAAVAWAVKAIVDWDAALHHYGYRGDSLAGAVNWTFSALAPERNVAVQQRAVSYYDEAKRAGAATAAPGGDLVFTTDPADHRVGTVTVRTNAAAATGSITLVGATFAATGGPTLTGAVPGVAYDIRSTSGAPGRPHTVSGSGQFSAGLAAAVRHYSTPGGQDTAGPGGAIVFDVAGADAAPRAAGFVPVITTQVSARYSGGGPFVDDVTFTVDSGEWPRDDAGAYLPLAASATVYRTTEEPSMTGDVPADAVAVGDLALVTDPTIGPDSSYRVTSDWDASEPGFYTAVWTIRAAAQPDAAALRLPADYAWTEQFGVASQVSMVPRVSSRAQTNVVIGATVSDTILIDGPVPAGGLDVSSSLYRATEGVAPGDTCNPDHLVWSSPAQRVTGRGEVTVTAPAVAETGIYYWKERAVDSSGALVHLGACGIEEETTLVVPVPTPGKPDAAPPSLAETGLPAETTRSIAGVGVTILTLGTTLFAYPRRRRFGASAVIG